jgi:IstB-like ATP binding protein
MTTTIRDPVSPDLRKTLRALKLGQMLATLPERLTLARQQKMAHADFLELVLADEVTRREAKSASLRARAAGLDASMRLDTWDESAAIGYCCRAASVVVMSVSARPDGMGGDDHLAGVVAG